jgi:DHA1 family tetracycline resistance protein-like MFS transporter
VLYTHYRFGWEELQNGLALALVGIMAALVQGVLIRRIVPKIGERRAVLTGLVIGMLGMVLYGLASTGWIMLAVIFVTSLSGIAGPAIQGLVAGSVDPSEQGAVQGSLTSLMSLTAIFAPVIATQLFGICTGNGAPVELPGAPFFAGALFLMVALAAVLRAFRLNPAVKPR